MQPPPKSPAVRLGEADTTAFEAGSAPPARRIASAPPASAVPPKLARMLLPGEHVTFGSTPHPVVFAVPLVLAAALVAALAGGLHVARGPWREALLIAGGVLLGATGALFVKRALRFAGLRVVSTNRRIFAIRGVIVRRITPLGNTALAGSTISQGVLGRMLGYGSIHLPLADGTPDAFRDMRDVLELYREFQAVAHGVDGEDWRPAVRQTIVP